MKNRILLCLLALLAGVASLSAAFIEPDLDARLRAPGDTENFSVILKLYSPRDIRALDWQLHREKAPLLFRHKTVIAALKANAEDTQEPVLDRLEAMKSEGRLVGFKAYWIDNLIVVLGQAEAILEIATDPAVESIGPNFKAQLIDPIPRGPVRRDFPAHLDNELTTPGQNAVGATRVNRELGFTGLGTLVAGLDTGVDRNHPALASRWRGLSNPVSQCWLDLIGGRPLPTDNNGHGTHTMGTMCGRAINGNDTITVGSAPRAQWIACNAIDQGVNPGFTQDILDAFQWFADPDGNPNTLEDVPDVIQNSWGVTSGHVGTPCYINWNQAILNCEAAGPVVIWSAGNEGPSASSLRSPANMELDSINATVYSVGAVDATNDPTPPYNAASWSSRGPSNCQPRPQAIKPEICAPGVDVYSSVPGGGYDGSYSGTSMAGPHVSGVVALMREACPDCDHITIKQALTATAIDNGYPPAGPDNTFGAGFLNAYDAVMAVASMGRVDGFVTTPGGTPVPDVRVQAVGQPNFATTNAAGYYNLSAREGTYTLRFTKFGYETVQIDSVQTFEGDTTRVSVQMSTVPQGTLVVRVQFQSGIAVQGASVVFTGTPLDTFVTNQSGEFRVTLPATSYPVRCSYTINLTPPQVITEDTVVTAVAGDTTRVVIELFVSFLEPTEEDGYGYRSYDRYDRGYPAPYDWVELDPSLGMPGTEFFYPHADSSVYLPTPFPLSFYGESDDTLTVNCNGWMLPGIHRMRGHINTAIPSNSNNDPPGIIAPFWDDLRGPGSGGQQFMWYDTARGRWILEFINQRLVSPGNRNHNWQVHFYDPAFYPTRTGDCQIIFNYGQMEYLTGCTIGIERPAEDTGIQVSFNGTRHPMSWPIENGSAVRFTTGDAPQMTRVPGRVQLWPASNQITAATIHLGGKTAHPNAAGVFSRDSVALAPMSAVFLLPNYEMWRTDGVALQPGTNDTLRIDAWRLDPPVNIEPQQHNGAVTLRWHKPLSVQARPNPNVRYYVHRDGVEIAGPLADTTFTDEPQAHGTEVTYTLYAVYRFGKSPASAPVRVTINLASRLISSLLPDHFALYPNYPNPFNPETRIRLDVPQTSDVRLEIYDLNGRLVRTLYRGNLNAGRHEFSWDSRDAHQQSVTTGVYLCRMTADGFTATQKLVLIK